MNQFTPRHSLDTMARLSNEDMADRHTLHTARPTAMQEALLGCIKSVCPADISLDMACLQT